MASDWVVPPVPLELKALAPYFQRAQELRVKDPVMAYWCTYFAAKQGISSQGQGRDVRPFLIQIMNILEEMRINLGDNDAVSDDDVGAAYIENFALRVFSLADNEDRKERATRSTAKKFLASANFFELLHLFDKAVDPDVEEKIRYAKWKAADLAKAIREGRKPVPGDANTSLALPPQLEKLQPSLDFAPSSSPSTSLALSPAVHAMRSFEQSPPSDATTSPLFSTVSDVKSPELFGQVSAGSPGQAFPLQGSPRSPIVVPSTPSPRSSRGLLLVDRGQSGLLTPETWSTIATPGTEDADKGSNIIDGIFQNRSGRVIVSHKGDDANALGMRIDKDPDIREVMWSITENPPRRPQNSSTVVDSTTPISEENVPLPQSSPVGLVQHPDGNSPVIPVKRVHFSPSVVGGLSSIASSLAGSSPSPEGYAPSLPTVPETPYSSDSERDAVRYDTARYGPAAAQPLPKNLLSESDVTSQDVSPVVQTVSLPCDVSRLPSTAPHELPTYVLPPMSSPAASPRQNPGLHVQSYTSPAFNPTASPGVPLLPTYNDKNTSSQLELTPKEVAKIQKHCRFAISALDYEDIETARKELRCAMSLLGD